MMWSLDDENTGGDLIINWPYFESAGPQIYEDEHSYAGDEKISNTRQVNFPHGLGETISALAEAGLVIEFVHEHKYVQWQAFPRLQRSGDGLWRMPEGEQNMLPLMWSAKARKPDSPK
jgi:hypothetical protein